MTVESLKHTVTALNWRTISGGCINAISLGIPLDAVPTGIAITLLRALQATPAVLGLEIQCSVELAGSALLKYILPSSPLFRSPTRLSAYTKSEYTIVFDPAMAVGVERLTSNCLTLPE